MEELQDSKVKQGIWYSIVIYIIWQKPDTRNRSWERKTNAKALCMIFSQILSGLHSNREQKHHFLIMIGRKN